MKELSNLHNVSSNQIQNQLSLQSDNNADSYIFNGINDVKKYPLISSEWIFAIGEELGIQSLSDVVAKKLAEDVSYKLREIIYKCSIRLKHSKKRRLTSVDVNNTLKNLYDVDLIFGVSQENPEYFPEANVFVPHETIIDLIPKINDPPSFSQFNTPFLQEMELVDCSSLESRNNYIKKVLRILFNGSQKTFQVFLNDCISNEHLGGEGIVDKMLAVARSLVISSNAQYTRLSTRTCQLIQAISTNTKASYPCHLNSVEKLTELLIELLLGQGFVNQNLESLFKDCALKLMLRWPSVANKYIPILKNVFLQKNRHTNYGYNKQLLALELLIGVEPCIFFEEDSLNSVLKCATEASIVWYKISLSICAFLKSNQPLKYQLIIEHFGDAILPYLVTTSYQKKTYKSINPPGIIRNRIRYAQVKKNTRAKLNRCDCFESTLTILKPEIRFVFSGSFSVPSHNLRRTSVRANYQILKNEAEAPHVLIASKRLLVFNSKKRDRVEMYDLSTIVL